MNLLEKFDTVEVKTTCHISEADKQFCERQQAAYTAALYGFQELTYFWEDMLASQKALLGQPDSSPRIYNQYLIPCGDDGPKITIHRLRIQILSPYRKMSWRPHCFRQSPLNLATRGSRNSKNTFSGPVPHIFIMRTWLLISCGSLMDASLPSKVCMNSAAAVMMPHGLGPSIRRNLSESMR